MLSATALLLLLLLISAQCLGGKSQFLSQTTQNVFPTQPQPSTSQSRVIV
jgi:hypothetical protein